jgi:XrtJ-associated TM-motif-TM protein
MPFCIHEINNLKEISMKKGQIGKLVSGIGLLAAASSAAYAQGGCVDSPENPTVVLGVVGAVSAGVPWLRAKWLSRRRTAVGSHNGG